MHDELRRCLPPDARVSPRTSHGPAGDILTYGIGGDPIADSTGDELRAYAQFFTKDEVPSAVVRECIIAKARKRAPRAIVLVSPMPNARQRPSRPSGPVC